MFNGSTPVLMTFKLWSDWEAYTVDWYTGIWWSAGPLDEYEGGPNTIYICTSGKTVRVRDVDGHKIELDKEKHGQLAFDSYVMLTRTGGDKWKVERPVMVSWPRR